MKKLLFILVFALVFIALRAQIEWRNNRTGIYPDEKGLLKTWPEKGPALRWYYDGLGDGHSSVAIANDKIYVTGMATV